MASKKLFKANLELSSVKLKNIDKIKIVNKEIIVAK